MNSLWQQIFSFARSFVTIIIGYVAVFLVNFLGGFFIKALFPGERTDGGIPLTTSAQIADLILVFLAGLVAAFIIVLIAHRKPALHALVFAMIAFFVDFYLVLGSLADLPVWYKVIIMVSIPPQIWFGARLGFIVRYKDKFG